MSYLDSKAVTAARTQLHKQLARLVIARGRALIWSCMNLTENGSEFPGGGAGLEAGT